MSALTVRPQLRQVWVCQICDEAKLATRHPLPKGWLIIPEVTLCPTCKQASPQAAIEALAMQGGVSGG